MNNSENIIKFEDLLAGKNIRVDSSGDDEEYTKTQIKGKRISGRGWKEPKKRYSIIPIIFQYIFHYLN